jgi:flagellar biosynthesis protein FlhF
MNIQRFHATTSREALAKARMTFGDGTLILSNRPTATGVEVVATTEDSLATLDQAPTLSVKAAAPASPKAAPATAPSTQAQVEADTEQLAMSTLSFQDYVRERMLQRRQETLQTIAPPAPPTPARPRETLLTGFSQQPSVEPKPAPVAKPVKTATAEAPASAMSQGIVNELHAMKEMIEERFNTLAWLGQAKQSPLKSNLMLKMIRAGYSPSLSRAVLDKMPDDTLAAGSMHRMMSLLERNLRTDAQSRALHEEGGVYALVGATGVGKTTTTAKLAGMCARLYGPASVGLITLDTYRIGAHEQLRTYGRMMGVVAHLAHDRAALQDLLNLLANKKMILIDTTGLAPRDARKREMLDVVDLPAVGRLLVLNAVGHGDTQDDVVSSFRSNGVQQAILSKVDEAVKLGPALDAAIRHQLILRGVTGGQRVPEDWERADATKLVRQSMRTSSKSAFDPQTSDLGFIFSQSGAQQQGHLHA